MLLGDFSWFWSEVNYLWCKISFCNFSHLSTNYIVHNMQEREISGSAASGPCFKEILLDSDQRLSYLWCKISFCNYFIFPLTALFTTGSICRSEHSDYQNVVVFPGWTSECCYVLHQNVDVHDDLHLGSSCMNEHMNLCACHMLFIWISGQ